MKEEIDKLINDYVSKFGTKHDMFFEFWVADEVGSIACFAGGYFVDFLTIKHDLESNVEKGLFLKWYDLTLDLAMEQKPLINYQTFLKLQ